MELSLVHRSNNETLVHMAGDMDALGCAYARQTLEKIALEAGQGTLVLDLEKVGFLDSSGIGAISFLLKQLKLSGGELRIINVNGQPRELVKLVGLHRAISVEWGRDEAENRAAS